MAKATRRKRPAARKPVRKGHSRLALSGWIVAAGVAIAWAAPQFDTWSERLPDFGALPDRVATLIQSEDRPVRQTTDHRGGSNGAERPDTSPTSKPAVAAAPVKAQKEEMRRPAVIPPIASETKTAVAAKADPKPAIPLPKPVAQSDGKRTAPTPPSAIPKIAARPSTPIMSAAVHNDTTDRPTTARPGDLAIRRYPFTTAPAIAYVGDLRTLRIIGGQGDWKKVEVASSGQIGWLRLQRYEDKPPMPPVRKSALDVHPRPAASLVREADAAVSR